MTFMYGAHCWREGVSENLGSAPSLPCLPRDPRTTRCFGVRFWRTRCTRVNAVERLPAWLRQHPRPLRPGGVMQSWQGPSGRGTGSIKAVVICISYCKSAAGLQRLLTENFTAEWIVSATLRLWGLLCGHFAALEGWDPS